MKSRHGLSKSPKELTGKRYLINVRHEGHLDVSSCNSKQNFTKQEMRLERERGLENLQCTIVIP